MLVGLISSLLLVFLSPNVWSPVENEAIFVGEPLFPLANPGIVSIPIGFIAAIAGTLLSSKKADAKKYDEIVVTANTGIKDSI
jgi:cation/acetate symporter